MKPAPNEVASDSETIRNLLTRLAIEIETLNNLLVGWWQLRDSLADAIICFLDRCCLPGVEFATVEAPGVTVRARRAARPEPRANRLSHRDRPEKACRTLYFATTCGDVDKSLAVGLLQDVVGTRTRKVAPNAIANRVVVLRQIVCFHLQIETALLQLLSAGTRDHLSSGSTLAGEWTQFFGQLGEGRVVSRISAQASNTVDAYAGYEVVFQTGRVTEVGCWAHARRRFFEALDGEKEHAGNAIAVLRRLYESEREAKDLGLDFSARRELRQREAKPFSRRCTRGSLR